MGGSASKFEVLFLVGIAISGLLGATTLKAQGIHPPVGAASTLTTAAPVVPHPPTAPIANPATTLKATSTPIKLFVMGKETFCNRLNQAFSSIGFQAGYTPAQAALIASGALSKVIQDFRSGRASDYLHSQTLLAESNLPMEKNIPGYIATAPFIGQAMGVSTQVSLALSASELRFIPHVQKKTDVIVVAKNAAALTTERVQKIIELAKQQDIKIHVLWVGEFEDNGQEIEEARVLAWIVAATGGRFTNIGGQEWPCANLM
jgi:hypothetical protein